MRWGAIEEAIWDAIGRIAGQPVARLLGGASLPVQPVYITYVWAGTNGQETITPKHQAEQAKIVRDAGFTAMKIQIFRRNYHLDAEACAEILAVGGPGFRVMVDRTADRSPTGLWTYAQALDAAQAEFRERTGGGVGGKDWVGPLLPKDFDPPVDLRWPEYVTTARGEEWCFPTPHDGTGAGEPI